MSERTELTEKRFDPHSDYYIDGEALNRLYRISVLMNDAHVFATGERRDLAQEMQVLLTGRTVKLEELKP